MKQHRTPGKTWQVGSWERYMEQSSAKEVEFRAGTEGRTGWEKQQNNLITAE